MVEAATVNLSPSWKTSLSSGWETKASRTTQCIHSCTPQPALTLSPKQPDESLLAVDLNGQESVPCGLVT